MIQRSPAKGVDVAAARAAAQKVVETHARLAEFLRAGQTLGEIDRFVADTLERLGCRSCFLGYKIPKSPAFPSHACLSVNDCVVHGTAGSYLKPMQHGDLLKIDIGVWFHGWIGDAAWTYSFGEPTPLVRRLMECGKESLRRGVLALRPGRPYLDWAKAVQGHAEGECGFHLIRGLGGHGIAETDKKTGVARGKLHTAPFVSNTVPTYPGEWGDATTPMRPGTVVAVEPMVAVGTGEVRQAKGTWPVYTADGSLSAHYEHDVLIGEEGPVVLTEGIEKTPDVIG